MKIVGITRIWSVTAAITLLSCCLLHRAAADAADGSGTGAEVLTQVATSINRGRYETAISQIDAELKQTAKPDQSLIYLRAYAGWKMGWFLSAQKDFSRLGDFKISPEWPSASDYVSRIQELRALTPSRVREVHSGSKVIFRVYYDENNAWTRGIVDQLPRAYDAGRKLLSSDTTETAVFVFKNRSRFDAFTRVHSGQRLPASVIAAASNGILLFCQYDAQGWQPTPDTTSDVFRGTVAHEYTHCLLQRAMGTIELPLWFDEGLAMVAGSELAPHDLQRNDYAIHRLLEKNAVMSLDELSSFYDSVEHGLRKGEGKTDPYQQGFHMTRYFLSRMKQGELPAFLDLVLKTGSLETAFRRNQGMTLSSFYHSWLNHAESTTRLTSTVTKP